MENNLCQGALEIYLLSERATDNPRELIKLYEKMSIWCVGPFSKDQLTQNLSDEKKSFNEFVWHHLGLSLRASLRGALTVLLEREDERGDSLDYMRFLVENYLTENPNPALFPDSFSTH